MTPFDGGRARSGKSSARQSGHGGAQISEEEIERIRSILKRAVRRICPPWLRDQCDDLVQTSLLRVVQLTRGGGNRKFSASYLDKTAYSALIDEIRRRRIRREIPLEPESHEQTPAKRPGPEDDATGSQIGRAIQDCLRHLIDSRRRAMTLYLREHSARRIAELMGWTVRQAENLILRGRQDLRQCLAGKGWTL